MRSPRKAPLRRCRPAFTLVELLVVIAIILVLAGLTAAAYFYWVGSQQGHNTEGTIRTVSKVLQEQWAYVVEQAKKESPSGYAQQAATNGGTVSDPGGERARVLWIKVRLMEAFPTSYGEINDPTNNVYILLANYIPNSQRKYTSTYQRLSGGLKNDSAGGYTESAACLLMALSVNRGGSSLTPDQLGASVADTDGDGVKEIIDNWRQPIQFYRFGWGTSQLNGSPATGIQGLNPAPVNSKGYKLADPLDPAGTLFSWPTTNNPYRASYELYAHKIANTTTANYVIPVLVSAGPDQKLGLPSPAAAAPAGLSPSSTDENDNIYSFNLR